MSILRKYGLFLLALMPLLLISVNVKALPIAADVVFVVDESGSMSGEHTWLGGMISDLEAGLMTASVGVSVDNRYALVGYGGASGGAPRTIAVGGGQWGNATAFAAATGSLIASGGFEDGWQAIDYFFDNYTLDADHALNIVLVTDEDRDNGDASLTYDNVLLQITSNNALLNAVLDCGFADGSGASAIGVDSDGNAYMADGSGGYNESTGGQQSGFCDGSSDDDYADMAWASGGAAWDLDLLRAGGLTAQSFTNAFVDIKVQEIIRDTPPGEVPEPATLVLISLGLIGVGAATRRKKC